MHDLSPSAVAARNAWLEEEAGVRPWIPFSLRWEPPPALSRPVDAVCYALAVSCQACRYRMRAMSFWRTGPGMLLADHGFSAAEKRALRGFAREYGCEHAAWLLVGR